MRCDERRAFYAKTLGLWPQVVAARSALLHRPRRDYPEVLQRDLL
ncbi:hypothetical protein PDR5_42970 [Pseudomonas sp. DR 5-09]|nr:hypothetical protein PDR5_42970 [Pseudomonas sp. DR 5-09]